jgi:signal transduction histidine kinase
MQATAITSADTFPKMNGRRRLYNQMLLVYGSGVAIGLHLGLLHLMMYRSVGGALFVLASCLVHATATLCLWQWVLPRFSSYSLPRRVACQVAVAISCFAALMVLSVELHALLFDAPSMFRLYSGGPITVTIAPEAVRRAPYFYALIPVLPAAVLCLVGFNQHWWRMFVLEGRHEELRELAASAHLAALRAQVNPHFLFNSLNTIAQLIPSDPVKAEICVERLAEIFRYMLTRGQTQFVSLADELSVVEAYLEIERARFGEDLVVEEKVEDRARHVLLPGLILQPLVENAVKHGISRKIGGGRVTIEATLEEGDLRLAVRDTGAGVREGAAIYERGVGLRNVRDRLLRLYGSDYVPEVVSRPGQGTTVSLRIPVAHGSA